MTSFDPFRTPSGSLRIGSDGKTNVLLPLEAVDAKQHTLSFPQDLSIIDIARSRRVHARIDNCRVSILSATGNMSENTPFVNRLLTSIPSLHPVLQLSIQSNGKRYNALTTLPLLASSWSGKVAVEQHPRGGPQQPQQRHAGADLVDEEDRGRRAARARRRARRPGRSGAAGAGWRRARRSGRRRSAGRASCRARARRGFLEPMFSQRPAVGRVGAYRRGPRGSSASGRSAR